RARALPRVGELARQAGVWLAGGLVLIGVLWLLVPDAAHRKVAVYDFWRTVLSPVLFFALILRWLRTERDLWRMAGAWLIAAALVGREAVEQYLFGQTSFMEGVGRVVSIYPSATALGIYLGRALALGLVLALFLPPGWRAWKLAAAALSVVIGLGTLFSFARGAWLGVLAALIFVGLLTRSRPLLLALGAALLTALASLPFVRVER